MTAYHVEFGQLRQIGRFTAETPEFERGQLVVIESSRGVELGRVVAEVASNPPSESTHPKILRPAGQVDLNKASEVEATRNSRFDACRKVFDEGIWPIEPIDVEPLLDGDRAVLYYFGPHQLETSGLSEILRQACGLNLVFEPVGKDISEEMVLTPKAGDAGDHAHSCGDCGSSSGGGCGTSGGGCGTGDTSKGGCSSCGISDLVSKRRRTADPVA